MEFYRIVVFLSFLLFWTSSLHGSPSNEFRSCSSLHSDGSIITKQDTALKGHVRQSLSKVSFIQCGLRCQRHQWCISINFQITTGLCELNDLGVQNELFSTDEEFMTRRGFVYSQLRTAKFGCQNNPCSNGGKCHINCATWQTMCICKRGFIGDKCEVDVDECSSSPCRNGATCNDQIVGYNCICKPGFRGKTCEKDIDECSINPCQNGGICLDQVSGYNCTCLAGYTGTNCEKKNSCDLNWPTQNKKNFVRASWSASRDISSFTMSVWLKVPSWFKKELVPFSYSTSTENEALWIKFKKDMKVEIKVMGDGKSEQIVLTRNNKWQHVCMTWDQKNQGRVQLYHDGQEINDLNDLNKNHPIKKGGTLIIGQKQGHSGGGFDKDKLMVGNMTGLNIWSRVFDAVAVKSLAQNCTGQEGDVVAWSDVVAKTLEGDVKNICPSTRSCYD